MIANYSAACGSIDSPDLKGTETEARAAGPGYHLRSIDSPDLKGTETLGDRDEAAKQMRSIDSPDLKGTETESTSRMPPPSSDP